jgi:hypothetical protein
MHATAPQGDGQVLTIPQVVKETRVRVLRLPAREKLLFAG